MTADIAVNGMFIWIFLIMVFNALAFGGSGISLVFWFAAAVMAYFGFAADPLKMGLLLAGGTIGPAVIWFIIDSFRAAEMQRQDEALEDAYWDQRTRQAIARFYDR
jgi:hypothetical protein